MTGAETIIRIYLCTSYADMQAERAFLHHFVFPKVAQKFLKKGFRLVIVDPCWGARSESEAEGPPTLERRFQAIEQCRPFFLGFVGSRENTIIEQIPFELGRKFPLIQHYSRSSQLQLEILLGAVRDPSRATHAFFYFRKPDFLKDVPPEQQAHFVIEDPLAARKFENFKGAVRAAKLPVYDYNCGWDHEAGCVTGLDELGKRVIADLLTVLSRLEREATTRSVKAEPPKPAVEQRKPTTASVPPPPVKAAPPKPAVEQPKPTTAPAPPPPVKAEPPKPAVEQRKPTTASVPPPPVKAEPPKPAVEQPKPTTASVPPPAVKAEPPKPAVEQPKPTTAPVPPPAVKAEPPKPAVEQPKPTTAPVPPPAVKAEPPKRVVEPQKPVVEPGLSPAAQLAADSEREAAANLTASQLLATLRKQLAKSQGSIASEASTSAEKPSVDTDSSAAPSAGVETKPIKIDDTLGTDVETIRSHIADLQAKQSPPPATSEIIQRLRTLREQLGQTSPLTKEGGNISGTSEQTTVPPPAPVDEDLDETVSSENLGGPENVAEEQDMEEMVDLSAPPAAEREGAAKTDPRIWMDDPEFNALPGLQDTGIADESMGWTHYGVEQPVDTNVTEIPGEEVEAVEFQSDDVLAGETDALSAETGQTFETPSEAMDTAWQTEDEVDLVELYGEENTAAEWNAPEEMVEEFVDEGEVEVVDEDENEAADRASAEEAEQLWEQADANPSDRRDAERVPVSLDVMCQPSIGRVEMRWRAKLRDLSYTGAQLVTDRRFEVGTILSIEVVKLGDEFTSLLARVMHVTEVPEGWALGCRFAKELSEKDMITLMEVSDI